ncbi:MAG: heat-shock protein Hsp20 [Deltaproteobacteria bacterium]|nr:MAG: heat-shock protein Hsp20 [Deltaproteobacteria bacterium]
MDYIKIKFSSDFDPRDPGMSGSMEDMFRVLNPLFSCPHRAWKPQMDIYETPEEIIILCEIAGVDKEKLEVEVSTNAVRVSGERTGLCPDVQATYRLAEIQYGKFERTLFLPVPIDTDKVSASYSLGLLQIHLAKSPTGVKRKIDIVNEDS